MSKEREKKVKDCMKKETILKIITDEADKLEELYREENEIHEDYYIWGLRRLEKQIKDVIIKTKGGDEHG